MMYDTRRTWRDVHLHTSNKFRSMLNCFVLFQRPLVVSGAECCSSLFFLWFFCSMRGKFPWECQHKFVVFTIFNSCRTRWLTNVWHFSNSWNSLIVENADLVCIFQTHFFRDFNKIESLLVPCAHHRRPCEWAHTTTHIYTYHWLPRTRIEYRHSLTATSPS